MKLLIAAVIVSVAGSTASTVASGVYASYPDVRHILAALAEILPPELKAGPSPEAAWDTWVAKHDEEIRRRLERGDDDTLVNWVLLGTTFTSRPRAAVATSSGNAVQIPAAAVARVRELVEALRTPGSDERRLFARRLLERQGYSFETAAERERGADYLLSEIARFAREHEALNQDLIAARQLGDVSEEFAARSRLYRTRGLSLDTSLQPGFAVEQALKELKARGLLPTGEIREVAVIGPGLDFSDKSSGYDFYPLQTLQPFALVDSLVRVGLVADAAVVRVTTLDLSPRVNDHLARARVRAEAGQAYTIRLPIDAGVQWTPDLLAYWRAAGDRIGTGAEPVRAPAESDVRVRTITVRPAVARRVQPEDVNITVQRLEDRRFDLVVATNVFVYYDLLDQVLAMANIEAMLRPGGFLLSNNALLELPSSRLRSVGYLTVQYSDRPDDGDHIVWYQAK